MRPCLRRTPKAFPPQEQYGRQEDRDADRELADRGDGAAQREQERQRQREHPSDRQDEPSAGPQLEPDLRPQGRRRGTCESEGADVPGREPSGKARDPRLGHRGLAMPLPRHAGHRETDCHETRQGHQGVLAQREPDAGHGPVRAREERKPQHRIEGERAKPLDDPVAGRPLDAGREQMEGDDPHHHRQQRERLTEDQTQDGRRDEVYRRAGDRVVGHRDADDHDRPDRARVEQIQRKAGLVPVEETPAIELRNRHPEEEAIPQQDHERHGGAVVDQGQCGRAHDEPGGQPLGGLQACQAPLLPQHGEDG